MARSWITEHFCLVWANVTTAVCIQQSVAPSIERMDYAEADGCVQSLERRPEFILNLAFQGGELNKTIVSLCSF